MLILPPKYTLGIESLDAQHSQIISLLDDIVKFLKKDPSATQTSLREIISDLKTYAYTHFLHEERQMEKVKYVDLENHKKMHLSFLEKVEQISKRRNMDESLKIHEMSLFLKEWFLNHIVEQDLKLRDSIKDFEVKEIPKRSKF